MPEFTGSIPTPSNGFTLKVVYSVTQNSQNITNNTSYVTATGYVCKNNSTYRPYNTTSDVTINIGGNAKTEHPSYNLGNYGAGSYMQIISHSATIPHGADGAKAITISLSMNGKLSNWYPIGNVSKSITLPTIPRASNISLNPTTATLGNDITVSISRASTSFTHTLQYDFGTGTWTNFATGATTTGTLSTKVDWASVLPNSTSGTGRIRCLTYNGSSLIGEKTATFTANIPDSVKPTISSINVAETATSVKNAGFTSFIQENSIPKISINASGIYGSSISSYSTTIEDKIYTGSEFTASILNNAGAIAIKTIVTDSRGRQTEKTTSISVLEYHSPTINSFTIQRCESDGTLSDDGNYIKIIATGTISSCNNKNANTYKIYYKLTSATAWTQLLSGTGYSINLNTHKTITGGFLTTNTYDVKIVIEDSLYSSSFEKVLTTSFTLMNFNTTGKGIGIGKVSEKNSLEVALPAEFTGGVTSDGKNLTTLITPSTTAPSQTTNSIWMKIVDATKKKFMMYVKEAAGHVLYKLSSQGVEMDNGNTLQQEFDTLNNNLTANRFYDIDISVIIGYRNNKPIYKLIKQFPHPTYNLSVNGELKISIPEIAGKRVIGYTANMLATYGCYMLPYAPSANKYPSTLVRHLYTTTDAYASYHNYGETWSNWTLELVIYYYSV